jgi:hypothetical protein
MLEKGSDGWAPVADAVTLQNKELEATEERKRKAKQLEMQRKESGRSGRSGGMSRTPVYPTYTPPVRPTVTENYDTYEAEKNKAKYADHTTLARGYKRLMGAGSTRQQRSRACSWARSPRLQICLSA